MEFINGIPCLLKKAIDKVEKEVIKPVKIKKVKVMIKKIACFLFQIKLFCLKSNNQIF